MTANVSFTGNFPYKFTTLTCNVFLPKNYPEIIHDNLTDDFIKILSDRVFEELGKEIFIPSTKGEAFLDIAFTAFEERYLSKSEYVVIALPGCMATYLDVLYPRLLVFLTMKPWYQDRFILVLLGKPVEFKVFEPTLFKTETVVFSEIKSQWNSQHEEWRKLLGTLREKVIKPTINNSQFKSCLPDLLGTDYADDKSMKNSKTTCKNSFPSEKESDSIRHYSSESNCTTMKKKITKTKKIAEYFGSILKKKKKSKNFKSKSKTKTIDSKSCLKETVGELSTITSALLKRRGSEGEITPIMSTSKSIHVMNESTEKNFKRKKRVSYSFSISNRSNTRTDSGILSGSSLNSSVQMQSQNSSVFTSPVIQRACQFDNSHTRSNLSPSDLEIDGKNLDLTNEILPEGKIESSPYSLASSIYNSTASTFKNLSLEEVNIHLSEGEFNKPDGNYERCNEDNYSPQFIGKYLRPTSMVTSSTDDRKGEVDNAMLLESSRNSRNQTSKRYFRLNRTDKDVSMKTVLQGRNKFSIPHNSDLDQTLHNVTKNENSERFTFGNSLHPTNLESFEFGKKADFQKNSPPKCFNNKYGRETDNLSTPASEFEPGNQNYKVKTDYDSTLRITEFDKETLRLVKNAYKSYETYPNIDLRFFTLNNPLQIEKADTDDAIYSDEFLRRFNPLSIMSFRRRLPAFTVTIINMSTAYIPRYMSTLCGKTENISRDPDFMLEKIASNVQDFFLNSSVGMVGLFTFTVISAPYLYRLSCSILNSCRLETLTEGLAVFVREPGKYLSTRNLDLASFVRRGVHWSTFSASSYYGATLFTVRPI